MVKKRTPISNYIESMLKEEVVYVCPLGISKKCQKFEAIGKPFTNHHIDKNPENSVYWNLIRICEPCHQEHNKQKDNLKLNRQIRLKKRNLAIQYFGGQAIDALRIAYVYGGTVSTPSSVLKLLKRGYLRISIANVMSIGKPYHASFQEYEITNEGKELIEKLLGTADISINDFPI